MPNWCENHIEIQTHNESLVKEIVSSVKTGKFLEYCSPFPLDEWNYWTAVEHWGTKWDIDSDQTMVSTESLNNNLIQISISTCTAWSPPLPALEVLRNKKDIVSVQCHYHEIGMGYCGVWREGIDEYLEYDKDNIHFLENEYLSDYWGLKEMFEIFDEQEA